MSRITRMAESRTLIVYYSRSGTTRKVAKSLSALLHCEIEKIVEAKERSGVLGYLRSAMEAGRKRPSSIIPPKMDPASYDLVIVGTPVWAWSVSSPVRAYLMAYRARLPDVAFFCTFGARGGESAFAEMETIVGKAPRACCALKAGDVTSAAYERRLVEFVKSLGRASVADHTGTTGLDQPELKRPAE
jgi:flavodoxin